MLGAGGVGEVQAQAKAPQRFLFEVRGFWSDPFQSKIEQTIPLPIATIDFEEDLGAGSEWGALFRAQVKITSGHHLRVEYDRVEYSGTVASTPNDIEIGGVMIPEGTAIVTDIPLARLRFAYWYLFRVGGDRFRVGPMVNAVRFSLDPSLSVRHETTTLRRIKIGGDAWGGTIGAEFHSYLSDSANLYGFAGWIGAGDLDGSWDAEFGLCYFLRPWLGISGSYRYSGNKILLGGANGFLRVQTNNLGIGVAVGF